MAQVTVGQRWPGILAGVAVVFIWSGWITLSRLGVSGQLTVYDMTALRFGTAALVTLPLWRGYGFREVRWGRAFIVALGCGFPYVLLTFLGLRTTGAAGAGVMVNGSLPIVSALLGWVFLRRQPRRSVWLTCAALGAANVCMLDVELGGAGGAAPVLGWACLLLAAFVLASYMLAVQAWGFQARDVLVLVPMINAALFVPIWYVALPSVLRSAEPAHIALHAAYQGLIVSVLALVLFTECVKRLGAVTSSLFMACVPACTAGLAWWALDEALAPRQVLGVAACSVALVYYASMAARRAAPTGAAGGR